MFNSTVIYQIIVGVAGALFFLWAHWRINAIENQKKKRIGRMKRFESLKTETPLDQPMEEAKESALENVKSHFSILRKMILLTIFLLWVLALVFPLLDHLPVTLISIAVAASGVIVGIASRPFIENLISGIVISFSQPIRVGDTVIIDDMYGTIEDITISHTVLKVWNWRRYIIPNNRMLSKEITNCTIHDTYQWVHVEFLVSYESDINQVKALAIEGAKQSQHFSDYEEPRFWIMDMKENCYRCWIAAWADTPIAAWELSNDIRTHLISVFPSNGIKTHRIECRLSNINTL